MTFWSHFTSCIDECIEKKMGDSGEKQVMCICLVEVTRWKCGDGGAVSCWWTVVVGWYFLEVPVWKSGSLGEAEWGVWIVRAETWRSGSPYRSRMGYLTWLISCRLLRLNFGTRGEHLTSQPSWTAAWLLVTRTCPVCLVNELVLVFCTLLWLV